MPDLAPPDLLPESARLQAQPFTSDVPLIGPLIVWFRTTWNNIAARWYVQTIVEQQNIFNQLLVSQIQILETRLIEQDRLQTELIHQLAELTAMLKAEDREQETTNSEQIAGNRGQQSGGQ